MKKKAPPLIVILLLAVAALLGKFGSGDITVVQPPPTGMEHEANQGQSKPAPAAAPRHEGGLYVAGKYMVGGVSVVDQRNGKRISLGTIDLSPTLERIASGEKNPHRNDGSVFRNAGRKLPQKPQGYYREYVVPTPGIPGPGPQRLVVGKEGELYYTHDHYDTFIRLEGGQ